MASVRRFVGRLATLLYCSADPARVGFVAAAEDPGRGLAQALTAALNEEEGKKLMAPHLDNLKGLNAESRSEAVETVVMRQWWDLARVIVAKSHSQSVDLSFSVRKAVRSLKEEADELLRTLNPKYGMAQQVSPAFQWAQNDTCVFLTIKYTVRWNAPGALEVTEPSVNMTLNSFNFTGLGKHSNNKYRYFLSLKLFDHIAADLSTWSAASVGKLSVTLRKKWPRKWPRLLDNKKTKIGNMHLWMEMQEKMDSTLGGMTTVSNSPVTCAANEKLYCLATDTCKKPENCTQCPGKNVPVLEEHMCTGMPTEKASLTFKDQDMDQNQIAGEVSISKARNDFDIDSYEVYFGTSERAKLEVDGKPAIVSSVKSTGEDVSARIPSHTELPAEATHLLVFSKNAYGEYATPGSVLLKDAVLPKGHPVSLTFEDEDGDKGEVSGTITIGKATDETHLEEYALHWGKSDRRKIASSSFIRDVMKQADKNPTHHLVTSTKIPDGATHILCFAKNEHGEHPTPASIKIVDALKPCQSAEAADCPKQVQVSADGDGDERQAQVLINFVPARDEDALTFYGVYWGRSDCSKGGQSGAKNGHIKDVPAKSRPEVDLPANTPVPEGTTHVLVFSKGRVGESDNCVAAAFTDAGAPTKPEL